MPNTAERLAAIETMLGEVHLACVGNGSAGSSLRERTAALEEWRHGQDGLRHKGIGAAGNTIMAAAVAILVQALHLAAGSHA